MRKYLNRLYLIILILIPFFLLVLPPDYFDKGNSTCFSVLLLDSECYACGMTRAIQHLIHLDFSIAYGYNKLSLIVFPVLILAYYKEIRRISNLVFSN